MAQTLHLTQENSDALDLIRRKLEAKNGFRMDKSQVLSWLLKTGKEELLHPRT